jgi:O-antigen ligase
MIKAADNSRPARSKGLVFFEYVAFGLCLCVMALRATFTEGLNAQSTTQPLNLGNSLHSLSISGVLILPFVIWFIWSFNSKSFSYRFTTIEIGACIFVVGAIIAAVSASNKRAAITSSVTLLAPVLMAILLVQLLDSQRKIRLVLVVVAALGIVSAYQCAEQFFVSNKMMIEQYKQAPQTLLEPLGIRAGTFAQMLFEHRLYSRGIRGFFTTSNSAGSFALLASFAAVALFIDKFRSRKSGAPGSRRLLAAGVAVAIVIISLFITRSKGAIAASLIAAAMFAPYLLVGDWLKTHRKAIFLVCLLLVLAGGSLVVSHGVKRGGLPGGNSMLVRWQYWRACVRMYAEHPLAGVGPGNFVFLYPHYKTPSALETVSDPHNFVLSVLAQYGPLGLIGFLSMIFIPLLRRVLLSASVSSLPKVKRGESVSRKLTGVFVIAISLSLLLIRPMIMPVTSSATFGVMAYVIFTLYIAPVVAFAVGFWLLAGDEGTIESAGLSITAAALFCACVGVVIHNLIDFAIFEPGVLTTFWAVVACLIALDFHQNPRAQSAMKPSPLARIIVTVMGFVLIWAYFGYALNPVAKSTVKIQRANKAVSEGDFERAHSLLAAAAEDDRLSPAAASLNGRLYLHHFELTPREDVRLLSEAEASLLRAIGRNNADFKDFERLTEAYVLLAQTSGGQERDIYLNKALDGARSAVERYPGSGRLRFKLAEVAEKLGRTDEAVEQYAEAVRIEDSYREQFARMYPGREIFSRLGEERYQHAKERMETLSGKWTP